MRVLILITFLTMANISSAFDKSEYNPMDVDQIMVDSKKYLGDHTEGQSLLRPIPKIHLHEKIYRFPFTCDADLVIQMLKVSGIPKETIPPINHCMSIQSAKGDVFHLYIQDSIARFVEEEYKIGSKIHLWAMWVFVNISDQKPYFLVNGIGDDTPNKQMQSDAT